MMTEEHFDVELTDNPYFNNKNDPDNVDNSYTTDSISLKVTENQNFDNGKYPTNFEENTEYFENPNTVVINEDAYEQPTSEVISIENTAEKPVKPTLTKEQWGKRVEYTFNTIGFVVGLGNIWKFSSFCFEYGGGVFIPVYTLCYIIIGLPIFLMELYMGQFTSRGCIECWGNCRLLKGFGVSAVAMGLAVCFPYVMFIVFAIKYFILSCYAIQPWSNRTVQAPCNPNCTFSADIFFRGEGFHINASSGIGDLGIPHWEFVVAGLFIWSSFFLCLFSGLKFSGKSVYVTILFPYFAAILLLGHSLSLPGSGRGLVDYMSRENFMQNIQKYNIWTDAAIQIIFSLSLGQGGLTCLASFNDLRSNLLMNSVLITLIDFASSLVFGIIVFSYVGYVRYGLNLPITTQWDGLGLLFVIVPQAISETKSAQFWSALFYLLLIVLAFDVAMTLIRTTAVAIYEAFPNIPYSKVIYVNLGICLFGFITTIAMCTSGGVYFFQLIGRYGNAWGLLWTALFSNILIVAMYGGMQITVDIDFMLKDKRITMKVWKYAKYYFLVCWYSLTPIFLLFLLISKWVTLQDPFTYLGKPYPPWSVALGSLIAASIPLSGGFAWIYYIIIEKGPIDKRLRYLKNCKPGEPLWSIATSAEMNELMEIKRKHRERYSEAT